MIRSEFWFLLFVFCGLDIGDYFRQWVEETERLQEESARSAVLATLTRLLRRKLLKRVNHRYRFQIELIRRWSAHEERD